MQPQLSMKAYQFKPVQRQQNIRYQSTLFNQALIATAQEISAPQSDQPSEYTVEYSVRQSILTSYSPIILDEGCDLAALKLVEPSSSSRGQKEFMVPDQQLGEDKHSEIDFEYVSPLTPLAFQPQQLSVHCSKKIASKMNQKVRLRQQVQLHSGPVWAAQLSPDQTNLATGGRDGIVRVFYVTKSAFLQPGSVQKEDQTFQTAFTTQPTHLPAAISTPPLREFHGHVGDIVCLSINQNNYIVSGSMDKTARLWHHLKSFCLGVFQFPSPVVAVYWDPFNDSVFFVADAEGLSRFDLSQRKRMRVPTPLITHVTSNSLFLFQINANGVVIVRDKTTLAQISAFNVCSSRGKNSEPQQILGVGTSQNLNELLISSADGRVRVYSTWSGSQLQKFKAPGATGRFRPGILLQELPRIKSLLTEGVVERVVEGTLVLPSQREIRFFPGLEISDPVKIVKPGEMAVKKFEPISLSSNVKEDYLVLRLAYKLSQCIVMSVAKTDVLGENNRQFWVLFAMGEDGIMRLYDIQ